MVLKRFLPPPNALVVFEAAARHLSYTAASKELGVAQPAVTKQIRNLEDNLETKLFIRENNAITLTADGREFYNIVSESLQNISRYASELRGRRDRPVTIGSTFPFAYLWLARKLPDLRRALRGATINFLISDNYDDYDTNKVDLSIRFGFGNWPNKEAIPLFAEECFPIASPKLIEMYGLSQVENWTKVKLLNMPQDDRHIDWATWDHWFALSGVPRPSDIMEEKFYDYIVLLDAALHHEGIALGFTTFTDQHEKNQSLVRIGPVVSREGAGYYLVYSRGIFQEKLSKVISKTLLSDIPPWKP